MLSADIEHTVPQINGTKEQQEAMTALFHEFNVTTQRARTIIQQFVEEMGKGLDHEGATGNINFFTSFTVKKTNNFSQFQ